MAIFEKAGSWYIDFYVKGRRTREKIGPSKTLAKEVLRKRQTEVAEGKYFPERQRASGGFAVFIEKYWRLEGSRLKATGIRGVLDVFKERFGDRLLSEITIADVQAYYNETADRTTAATANRHMNFLSPLFNRAKEWGDHFGDNPAAKVRRRREENRRLRFLNEDEIERLLDCASDRVRPLLICAMLTGMRRAELLRLQWENVDIERGLIYILESKSGKPRELPMGRKLIQTLAALGSKTKGSVFGVPEITLRTHFMNAMIGAEIQDFRFHDLRHTFASHFIMRTGDLPALQKLLGHSSPEMTQRYAHLAKEHLSAKIDAFDAAMPIKTDGHHMDTKQIFVKLRNSKKY
jgi:integrase